ncbi:MAG: hypothetical protein ACQETH_14130 [Candidatus Rifleibacteriota bacterium]
MSSYFRKNKRKALIVFAFIGMAFFFFIEKLPGKKPAVSSLSDSVYQVIPNTVFNSAAPDNRYFLSGYICPGSGSARLSLITIKGGGKIDDSASVSIASDGAAVSQGITSEFGVTSELDFSHPDYPLENFKYYRVFADFNLTSNPSIKEIRVVLQNTSPGTASYSVWFDGIKLEKALDEKQKSPTGYHDKSKLVSPYFINSLEGNSEFYEW